MPSRTPGSFQQVPMPGGAPPFLVSLPEAATQSFVAGDLVTRSAGKVAVAASDPATAFGIARQNANGVTGHRVLIEPIRAGVLYQGNVRASADTFTEGTNGGVRYGTVKTAAGNWEINLSDTTGPTVCIVDTLEKSVDGIVQATQGGPVTFFFLAAVPEVSN